MMHLTPLDVRKKAEDFRRAVRGYEPDQVESFLALVADRMEQLVSENRRLAHELETIKVQLSNYQERERALNEALLAAQELREEARSQAERDAAVRLREAETHAEAILLDADQAIRHSQRRMEDLRARRTQFLRTVRGQLERFDDFLALEETRLEGEPDELGLVAERKRSAPAQEPAASESGLEAQASPGADMTVDVVEADSTTSVDATADAQPATAGDMVEADGEDETAVARAEGEYSEDQQDEASFVRSLEEPAASTNGSPASTAGVPRPAEADESEAETDVASRLADAIEATRNRLNAEDAETSGPGSE